MLTRKYTKVEEFLSDDLFVEWVLENSGDLNIYWENYCQAYPDSVPLLQQAKTILLAIKIKPVVQLSDSEITAIIEGVKDKLQFQEQPLHSPKYYRFQKAKPFLRYAALVLFVLSFAIGGSYFLTGQKSVPQAIVLKPAFIDAVNKTNHNQLIKLPDNSSVVLKPKASIRFPKVFAAHTRKVSLSGEAFFEVAKDARKPFLVYSDELLIKVLGTSFNVVANKGDDTFKIMVSTGKVAVSAFSKNKPVNKVLLLPNEIAVLYRNESRLEKAKLEKPLLLSKESVKIHFNFIDAPFSKVVSEIENAYGVKIHYDAEVMKDCSLTASLINQTLEERLSLICKAVEANYKLINRTIVIEGQGCAL